MPVEQRTPLPAAGYVRVFYRHRANFHAKIVVVSYDQIILTIAMLAQPTAWKGSIRRKKFSF
jgi:hypothetical protein